MHKSSSAIKSPDVPFWHTTSEDGTVLPAFLDTQVLDGIRNRKLEPTDIFISSFPKSGSTWLKSMLIDLLRIDIPMYCAYPTHLIEQIKPPRVFKEHLPIQLMPSGIKECKVVYLVRNPKDVVVSFQHHMTLFKLDQYDGDLETMVNLFCNGKTQFGDWCAHIRGWCFEENIPNLLILSYEEMIRDCFASVKRVLEFLGYDISDDVVRHVVEGASFEKMKKRDLHYVPGCPSFVGRSQMRDDKTHFLREGKCGTWKKSLTVRDSELIDEYIEKDAGLLEKLIGLSII